MFLRLPTCRHSPALVIGCALLAMLHVVPAAGQFSKVWSAEEVQIGQQANLFAHWEGRASLDGIFVELPGGWTLDGVVALRYGYEQVGLNLLRSELGSNVFEVSAPKTLQGAFDFVLQVQAGGAPGPAAWTIVPFTRREDGGHVRSIPRETYRISHSTRQITPIQAPTNHVLAFRGAGPPWLLRRSALPDFGTRATYTVEFWMRTTDLNEVVLSTWSGEERSDYPLELIVDAGGRLRYYRGEGGQHVSMATASPVADGQWHHIALTHDPLAGWTRLFLDGGAVDSLYSPVMPTIAHRTSLALGGRLPGPQAAEGAVRGFTGLLDELRLWPRARRAQELRRTMHQPLEATGGDFVSLGFEETAPPALIEQRAARTERVFSDLAFYYPVRNMQAVVEEEGVQLTWETEDPHTTSFIVERSTDGTFFETVSEVVVSPSEDGVGGEEGFFEFYDTEISAQVVFFRIRQRFEGGAERLSGMIKLGLGRDEEEVILVGNFPNPFNPSTTITYEVREPQRVRIAVWDLSGQQVAELVDHVHQAGTFETSFEGADLPSGTYFVRLQSSTGPMQIHKIVLMK